MLDTLAPDCAYIKLHGEAAQTFGVDLLGCYRGRAFAIEIKRPGGKPTERQLRFLRQWDAAGAITGVAESWEQVMHLLGVPVARVQARTGVLE